MHNDSAVETPSNAFREVLEVNLVAPNSLNYYTIPFMLSGSAILYVGSTLAEKAVPGSYSYVVSKHAMIGMMRATCQDLAGRNIHTACICPGFTDTEMLRAHVTEEAMDSVRSMSAYNRLIDPDEIADCLYWTANHPVLNGSVIHANLGQIES
jgi:NAD(P)-dependent dehydrogenase (short-subunit alcohol dehydrogenase family)